jgi:hypothetical protein
LRPSLARAGFWSLPKLQVSACLDGVTWEIERRHRKRWHRAVYANPPNGAYRDLGQVFIEVAKSRPLLGAVMR